MERTSKKRSKVMKKIYVKMKKYMSADEKELSFLQKAEFVILAISWILYKKKKKTDWVGVAYLLVGLLSSLIICYLLTK